MKLSATEKLAVQALVAAKNELVAREAEYAAEVEKSHGLEPGSLGKTHDIDVAKGEIVARQATE